jgi:hypothetical protein
VKGRGNHRIASITLSIAASTIRSTIVITIIISACISAPIPAPHQLLQEAHGDCLGRSGLFLFFWLEVQLRADVEPAAA